MLVAESADPTARPASPGPRGAVAPAGGAPSRVPSRGPDRLLERIDAHFAHDVTAVSVLLVTPDGPVGELRPRAVWPPRSIPPAHVVQASVRASRTDRVVTASVDARRPRGATVVAARIENRDRMLGVVSVLVDGPPPDVARAIGRWLELFEALSDDAPRRPPTGEPPASRAAGDAAGSPATPTRTGPAGDTGPDAVLAGAAGDEADDAIADPAVALRAVACHRALFGAARVEDGVGALLRVLARQHGCVRIACGWTVASRREGIVLSGGDEGRPSAILRDAYAAAMDEALARGGGVAWPEPSGRGAGLPVAQSRLAGARRVAAVCSVPLAGGAHPVGALTLERDGAPFDARTLDELERVAAFLGPALAAARRSARPLSAWIADLRGVRRATRAPARIRRAAR
jgi:hypothetical protein